VINILYYNSCYPSFNGILLNFVMLSFTSFVLIFYIMTLDYVYILMGTVTL
jgi:hypothetical protein